MNKGLVISSAFLLYLVDDSRIRTIPFPTRRPTFNEVKRVHQELSSVQLLGKSHLVTIKITLPWSNWNLECWNWFLWRGKNGEAVKNPRSMARTNNKLNPCVSLGRNRTGARLVGGERSHHCAKI